MEDNPDDRTENYLHKQGTGIDFSFLLPNDSRACFRRLIGGLADIFIIQLKTETFIKETKLRIKTLQVADDNFLAADIRSALSLVKSTKEARTIVRKRAALGMRYFAVSCSLKLYKWVAQQRTIEMFPPIYTPSEFLWMN